MTGASGLGIARGGARRGITTAGIALKGTHPVPQVLLQARRAASLRAAHKRVRGGRRARERHPGGCHIAVWYPRHTEPTQAV